MKFLFRIGKHLSVKSILLGLITILVGTFFKFIVIPKLLALFYLTLSEIMGYIVASFIALIVKLGIKDLVEQLGDILMPYLFMNTNSSHESGNESANEKSLDKGKGRALNSSDSEGEFSKKRKIDKGKATVTESDSEKSLSKNRTKTLVSITGINALDQHKALSDRIHELMSMQNLLTEEERLELKSLLEIARSHTNVSPQSNSHPASSNSSGSVSANGHSSNDEFPPYNPKDYESGLESENKGESSNK